MEFALRRDQDEIDRLVTAETFDEKLVQRLLWNQWPWWGYQEYVDIFRAAWKVNRERSEAKAPFRIIGLNCRMDWSHVWSEDDRNDPEVMKKVLPEGSSDEVMAETIRREILAREEKALIYSGINHAYTRFLQPRLDEETGLVSFQSERMGNRIYRDIAGRCFLIFLHAPWPAAEGYSAPEVYPAGGVIDALFSKIPRGRRRAGFDIVGSPFGRLEDTTSYWSRGLKEFRLDMFCDGWVYQKPLSEYEGVTVVKGWFSEGNQAEAIAQISNPDPRVKNRERTVQDLTEVLESTTDFRRFAKFH
jgi:hypothetical protein